MGWCRVSFQWKTQFLRQWFWIPMASAPQVGIALRWHPTYLAWSRFETQHMKNLRMFMIPSLDCSHRVFGFKFCGDLDGFNIWPSEHETFRREQSAKSWLSQTGCLRWVCSFLSCIRTFGMFNVRKHGCWCQHYDSSWMSRKHIPISHLARVRLPALWAKSPLGSILILVC